MGSAYALPDGQPVTDKETLHRIRGLAVPPAWSDVWICPWPNGHIQAVGTDAAGRRQYRYHDQWRTDRDREKFERVLDFAAALPKLRATVQRGLAQDGLGRERVLASVVRLLDVGFFRIGGEEYAQEHETFGVASLRKEHVRIRDGVMVFEYPAKGSVKRTLEIRDAQACDVVTALRRRRSGGPNLFVYKQRTTAGSRCTPTTSTTTSRRQQAKSSRRRTSAPGRAPSWLPTRSPSTTPCPSRAPVAVAPWWTRSQRSPKIWATRPPLAVLPTSIPGSLIPSRTEIRSAHGWDVGPFEGRPDAGRSEVPGPERWKKLSSTCSTSRLVVHAETATN